MSDIHTVSVIEKNESGGDMSTLMLMRMKPLTEEERRRLPFGCRAVDDKNSVVARADVELPLSETFKLAVAMGRAVPDASFAFHEQTAPGAEPLRMSAPNWSAPFPGTSEASSSSERLQEDVVEAEILEEISEVMSSEADIAEEANSFESIDRSWRDLLAEGNIEAALESAALDTMDSEMRIDLKNKLASEDELEAVFVCRLARKIQWKSLVLPLRNAFHHPHFEVRREACLAVGELAGPSMSPFVHLLLSDVNPEVQQAARATLKKLERTR